MVVVLLVMHGCCVVLFYVQYLWLCVLFVLFVVFVMFVSGVLACLAGVCGCMSTGTLCELCAQLLCLSILLYCVVNVL